jgi:hypothetical protein
MRRNPPREWPRAPKLKSLSKMSTAELESIWRFANGLMYTLRSGSRRRSKQWLREEWRAVRDRATILWHEKRGTLHEYR